MSKTVRTSTTGMRVRELISDRVDFKTSGSLHGETHGTVYAPSTGRLPERWANQFKDDFHNGPDLEIYVVWSYGTPIAWFARGGWVVPPVKYSVTTSKHQGTLTYATPRLDG